MSDPNARTQLLTLADYVHTLETSLAHAQGALKDETAERKALARALEKAEPWEPEQCRNCARQVPGEIHTKLFACLGVAVPVSMALAAAWAENFCCVKCAEAYARKWSGNVIPMEGHR
jgi:hypothetical protein